MQLFWQALTIMTLGMSLVFFFLFALIQGVRLSARIVQRYEVPDTADAETDVAAPAAPAAGRTSALAVALAVAITERRQQN
jgi:sodium pump decarboxylase gamma subunit